MDEALLDELDRESGFAPRQKWRWHIDLLGGNGRVEIICDGLTIAETFSTRNAEHIVELLNKAEAL